MKIDFNVVLKALNGETVKGPKSEDIMLKDVCINALNSAAEDMTKVNGQDKYRRGKLAQKIYNAEGPLEISSEDITLVKNLIGKKFEPHVVMATWDLLDPMD